MMIDEPFPISKILDLNAIGSDVDRLSEHDVLDILISYDIIAWPLRGHDHIFVVKDFETTRTGNYIWSSHLITVNPISLYFNLKYNIKILTLNDLKNILYGIKIHEAYQYSLKMLKGEELEIEVRFVNRHLGVLGVADAVGKDYVIEIKSSKPKRGHVYQLLASMFSLNKTLGFIVYPNTVEKLVLSDSWYDILKKRLNSLRRIYSLVKSHDLQSLCTMFSRHEKCFVSKYKVHPIDLMKTLQKEGFIG